MDVVAAHAPLFIGAAAVLAFYMCWAIGANDVANAMGPTVGSGAMSVRRAVVIAAVFELAGAVFVGRHVTATLGQGIVDPSTMADQPELLAYGMLAVLLACALWLTVASWRGWPVSTTHAVVGGIVGFAVVGVGSEVVDWTVVGQVGLSWIISPVAGGVLAALLMSSVRTLVLDTERPAAMARRWAPVYAFAVGAVITFVTLFEGLHGAAVSSTLVALGTALAVGAVLAAASHVLVGRAPTTPGMDERRHLGAVERVFAPLMVFTACAMAFAHGSNDVANGAGPLAMVYAIAASGGAAALAAHVPLWMLLLGGGGIVLGILTLGARVMATVGTKITALTPTRGYCATLAAATVVIIASRSGMPVSTTHVVIGSVVGLGLGRSIGVMDLRVLGGIVFYWLLTLPVGAGLTIVLFWCIKGALT